MTRLIVAAGGTGGHLYPALAVADALRKKTECSILFAGTSRGLEATVVPQYGYPFRKVWIQGLHRRRFTANLLFPLRAVVSLFQAGVIIMQFRPQGILGTGAYVSWPFLAAGVLLGKRIFLQEQNWIPGIVVRMMSPWAKAVFISFTESAAFFRRKSNLVVSGNPTRAGVESASRGAGLSLFGLSPKRKTVLVFGGSQGSRVINEAVLAMLDSLMARGDVQLLWASGPRWNSGLKEKTAGFGDRIRLFDYIGDMAAAYAACDLVVCRAGATTVAEVARAGLPAVLVPLATAAAGHQEKNARMLVEKRCAEMVLENELSGGKLEKAVFSLLDDAQKRFVLARNIRAEARPEAADVIADTLLSALDPAGV